MGTAPSILPGYPFLEGFRCMNILLLTGIALAVQEPPLQISGSMLLDNPTEAPNLQFSNPPHILGSHDRQVLRNRSDGFSVIMCRKIDRIGRPRQCSPSKWEGRDRVLDRIAVRAIRRASVTPEQAMLYSERGELITITIRFSESTKLPAGNCPVTWCRNPIPAPPPPPRR